ncbi:MAG: hypothetical protein HYY44_02505 [Deltaproteobacteria bacterium]|nr:hypothetical protein [Deltaproteobacteria bacterium]
MKLLNEIQEQFEKIYRLPPLQPVQGFLIDEQTARRNHLHFDHSVSELLLIVEQPPETRIGLYISREVLERLEDSEPFQNLTSENLEDFCTAVEGVSHFLYFLIRSGQTRPVSPLELELQAEVDKFVLCTFMLEQQGGRRVSQALIISLFENYHLIPSISLSEQERYQLANRLAWQYCQSLKKFSRPIHRRQWVREIRRFHQKNLQEKIHLLTTQKGRVTLRE